MTSIHPAESFPNQHPLTRAIRITIVFSILVFLLFGIFRFNQIRAAATVQNNVTVSSVSAASFIGSPATLAPNSIVAAFGTQLASGTQIAATQPLPTALLNTTVTVGGVPAPLFFVSPGQINYLIPPTVPAGDAQVVISAVASNGDQIISRGQMRIAPTAPAIFTANATGTGVPAAVTGRVNAAGQFVFDSNPPFEPDPVTPGRVIPSPIDVGTDTQPAFLILYGTGLRNAAAGSTRAIIGGIEVPVTPVAAPGFTGLDQINLQIPVALKGRGLVDVTLVASGLSSNTATVNLAGTPNSTLAITSFSITDGAIAGQTVVVSGAGFSTNATDNIVRFGSAQARVIAATASQLTVLVPFGAESGRVAVQTPQGEARSAASFRIKTSVSGLVQSTGSASTPPAPLEGVAVRVLGTNISVRTNQQGAFVIADIPTGINQLEIDGGTTSTTPPYPRIALKTNVQADRDNQFPQPVSLQQITGGSGTVGLAGFSGARMAEIRSQFLAALNLRHLADLKNESTATGKTIVISDRGLSLEIPIGTNVKFPDGKTGGTVQLTVVERSRLPGLTLPAGVYPSAIAQITPLGAEFSPGASLIFPNPNQAALPPGAKVDLYRYDVQRGGFIKRGTATVSANRSQIVSDGRVVDLGSLWFATAPSGVTTVTGRVVDALGFPVPRAQVSVNGRAGMTDANGGFSLSDVAASAGSQIQVEALLPQQWGTSPRGTSAAVAVAVGGVTNAGTIALSNTGQTGLVLSPFVIYFGSGAAPAKVDVTLTQPAPAAGLSVALTSDDTSVVTVPASVTVPAGRTTVSFNATRVGAGYALIKARATLSGNVLETVAVAAVAAPAPVLASVTPGAAPAGATIDLTGTGLSSGPDDNFVFYVRNNQVIGLSDPDENRIISNSNNRTVLRAVVPKIPGGAVNIVVVVVNGMTGIFSDASAPLAFNIISNQISAPLLASVSPAQGKPRDQVAIIGGGFSTKPEENRVIFHQDLNTAEARVLQASETRLVVEVPSQGVDKGLAQITVERFGVNGTFSDLSNALDFTFTDGATAPAKPTLTSVLNTANSSASGRDGDRVVVRGSGFGLNYYDPAKDDVANSEPLITLLLFYQNNQLVNFALPVSVQNSTQLTALIPTGLALGATQITTINFDLETGLLSDESNAVNFTISVGSLRHIDEDEPNDSPETATDVSLPLIVDGVTAKGDAGDLVIPFNNGTSEVLTDLFSLSLDKTTTLTISLAFNQTADLDLFILQDDGAGGFDIIASSAKSQGVLEQISGPLPAGNYLIAIGVFSGSSQYLLTLTPGLLSATQLNSPNFDRVRIPAWVERRRN